MKQYSDDNGPECRCAAQHIVSARNGGDNHPVHGGITSYPRCGQLADDGRKCAAHKAEVGCRSPFLRSRGCVNIRFRWPSKSTGHALALRKNFARLSDGRSQPALGILTREKPLHYAGEFVVLDYQMLIHSGLVVTMTS